MWALSIKEAQNKIVEIEEKEWKESKIEGYKIAERESEYGNIKQRWLIIESEARKKSSVKQVEKEIEKQREKAEAALRQLSRQEFACIPDGKIAIEKLSKSWKYHQIKEVLYIEKIEHKKAGRFILATNILEKNEWSNQQVLEEYKDQQCNERGFRFLKDPLFFTSSVFVKSPKRVEAMAMMMGLCLLVYNLAQRKLRQELAISDGYIRNQVKKSTTKPTMRWVFQMFQSVHLLIIDGKEQMSNFTEERQNIVNYLGNSCGKYYLMM